jgi:2-hydroxychromene-2-carboxylate isomerase
MGRLFQRGTILSTLARMKTLEFFFDCSSPWTYLAFTRIHEIVTRTKAKIVWRPILVGGVFNAVNKDVYERRANPDPRKASYSGKDLQDWARLAGIRIGKPPVFPVRAVAAMRSVLAADEQGRLIELSRALFEAYWGDLKDIGQTDVLREACRSAGLEPDAILARADAPDVKERLRANTEEVIARGGFGSPTMFVGGDDMYFGNDRLPLVEAALARSPPSP